MKLPSTAQTIILYLTMALWPLNAAAQPGPDYEALVRQGNAQLQTGSNDVALTTAQSAIKLNADRWEAYALAGGALMNLRRYEEAADDFSHAIDHAPEAKQTGLRDLRKQCLLAETAATPNTMPQLASPTAQTATTTQAEIVLWKSIENSPSLSDFQTYLDQYPHGAFSGLAKRHLEEIAEADRQRDKQRAAANLEEEKSKTLADPATDLMWTRADNGTDIDWQQAVEYCRNMTTAGHSDWRLPTIAELRGIYDKAEDTPKKRPTYTVREDFQLSGIYEWSSTQVKTDKNAEVFCYFYHPGGTETHKLADNFRDRALCVRNVGK
jgi:tetratricopeptide (TPR) repeat protein